MLYMNCVDAVAALVLAPDAVASVVACLDALDPLLCDAHGVAHECALSLGATPADALKGLALYLGGA